MEKMRFAEVLDIVCKSPAAHTMNGTFAEIVAFLDGYAKGAEVKDGPAHYSWTPFLRWLAVKFNYPKKTWPLPWEVFLDSYPDEETALKELARFYREYAAPVE
jgi:hypothetical protein